MAGALDTIGKSRADLQEEERKRQEEERRQQEMAVLEQQRTTFESVDPEGLSRSAMRKYDDASYMRSLNAAGELNRSGQRRLARTEERVIRDYDRGLNREQREQDRAFMSETNAKVGPSLTAQPTTQAEAPATILRKVYTKAVKSPFTETAFVDSGLLEEQEDFDPFD
jgi:hypothetical protein